MIDFSNLPPNEAVFVFDIADHAHNLEFLLGDKLLPAPEGIYLFNKLEPVMTEGNKYYVDENNVRTLLLDINVHTNAVYNEDDVIVIPKKCMENKERFISNKPILPYRGLKIFEILVKEEVYSKLFHMDGKYEIEKELRSHLVENISEEDFKEVLKSCNDSMVYIKSNIDDFIGKDNWHIYVVSILGKSVIIEKIIDIRIHQWNLMKEKGLIKL